MNTNITNSKEKYWLFDGIYVKKKKYTDIPRK